MATQWQRGKKTLVHQTVLMQSSLSRIAAHHHHRVPPILGEPSWRLPWSRHPHRAACPHACLMMILSPQRQHLRGDVSIPVADGGEASADSAGARCAHQEVPKHLSEGRRIPNRRRANSGTASPLWACRWAHEGDEAAKCWSISHQQSHGSVSPFPVA